MGKKSELTLFGDDKGWDSSDWTASDDRVRGGKSQSYLECSASSARFHGTLDIKTLGGAGFASQRTTGEDRSWDLSDYDGIRIDLGKADGKRYTFILKDELLPRNPDNGREQSTTSYEYDITVSADATLAESFFVFVPWKEFKPTYRGKEKKDASKLDTKNVKRLSIMMRSFFGDQEGDFSLNIKSIKAVSPPVDLEKGAVGARSEKSGNSEKREEAEQTANAEAQRAGDSKGTYMSTFSKLKMSAVWGAWFAASCLLVCYWKHDARPAWWPRH